MSQKTPLYDEHVEAGGRMVEFAGWQLPIRYGSLVEEHRAVLLDQRTIADGQLPTGKFDHAATRLHVLVV